MLKLMGKKIFRIYAQKFCLSKPMLIVCRASDFFHDLWAEVTHGAKKGRSFSEMMGPSISN